jgi:hypothetical protein
MALRYRTPSPGPFSQNLASIGYHAGVVWMGLPASESGVSAGVGCFDGDVRDDDFDDAFLGRMLFQFLATGAADNKPATDESGRHQEANCCRIGLQDARVFG